MYTIIEKKPLTEQVTLMKILAPFVAKHAKPGQFVMLRVHPDGERIPLTIAESESKSGLISIIYQVVGSTTRQLNHLKEGQSLADFAGPMGQPTDLEGLKRVLVIGGGVGCAIAYPIVLALSKRGCHVDTIIGFKQKEFVFLETEFRNASSTCTLLTDDGSYGTKGWVTDPLKDLLKEQSYDTIFAIGPLPMMKAVSEITRRYQIKTMVSMNPIMVDGTGMCGGCRVLYDGQIKFACVDGPDFDAHLVDFDDAMRRNRMYETFESQKDAELCRLTGEKRHDQ